METVSEEAEDEVGAASAAAAAASVAAAAASASSNAAEDDKKLGRGSGGNFRVNMNVIVRVRPLQSHERREGSRGNMLAVKVVDKKMIVFDPADEAAVGWSPRSNRRKSVFGGGRDHSARGRRHRDIRYAFDRVFDPQASNREIFDECVKVDVLDALLKGFNCSVFAYGATGAGKTFTMLGNQENPGIMYRTVKELYSRIEELREEADIKVQVTYIEIYNEDVKDLINAVVDGKPPRALKIWEDGNGKVTVAGVSFHTPKTAEDLLEMLEKGNRNRTQHPTDANQESSRSHAVFQVFLTRSEKAGGLSKDVIRAKMSLVDLAGSERATMLSANSGDRMREGANINRSLLALGNCINALADSHQRTKHVNFRDSNLTRLLKDSLGGNCRTVMIAAVSPAWLNSDDTHNTLNYANRAKDIRCDVTRNVVNVDSHVSEYAEIVKKLKNENENLKAKIRRQEGFNMNGANSGMNPGRFGPPRNQENQEILNNPEIKSLMSEVSDFRRKQLTLECGILDNEAKMNRKRKLVDRKNLFEEGNQDSEDLKAALETIGERTEYMKSERDGLVNRLRETHSTLAVSLASAGVEDVNSHPQLQMEMSQAASLDTTRVQSFLAQQLAKQERLNEALHELLLRTFSGFKERHNLLQGHGYATEQMNEEFLSIANRFVDEERDIAFASTRREMALDDLDERVRSEMMTNGGVPGEGGAAASSMASSTASSMDRPNVSDESVNAFVALLDRVRETSFSSLAVSSAAAAEASSMSAASSINSLLLSRTNNNINSNGDKTVLKKKSSLKTHSNRRRSFSANAAVATTTNSTEFAKPTTPGARRRARNNNINTTRPPLMPARRNGTDPDNNGYGKSPRRQNQGKSPRQYVRKAVRVNANDNYGNNNNGGAHFDNRPYTPSRQHQPQNYSNHNSNNSNSNGLSFGVSYGGDAGGSDGCGNGVVFDEAWPTPGQQQRRLGTPGRIATPGRGAASGATPGRDATPGQKRAYGFNGNSTPGEKRANVAFEISATPGINALQATGFGGGADFWASPSVQPLLPPPPPQSSGQSRSGGNRRAARWRVDGTPGQERMTPGHTGITPAERRWTPFGLDSGAGSSVFPKDHVTKNLFPDSPDTKHYAEAFGGADSPGVLPLGASPVLPRSETKSQQRQLQPPPQQHQLQQQQNPPSQTTGMPAPGAVKQARNRHRRSVTAPNAESDVVNPKSRFAPSNAQNVHQARVPFAPQLNLYNVSGAGGGGGGGMNLSKFQQNRRMSRIPGLLDAVAKPPRQQQQNLQHQQPQHHFQQQQSQHHFQPQQQHLSQQSRQPPSNPHSQTHESNNPGVPLSSLPSYMRPTAAARKKRQSYVYRKDGISLPIVDKEN